MHRAYTGYMVLRTLSSGNRTIDLRDFKAIYENPAVHFWVQLVFVTKDHKITFLQVDCEFGCLADLIFQFEAAFCDLLLVRLPLNC